MQYRSATVIISIYKNIEALKFVLDSLQEQTHKDFDVIVSEDAEHPEVKAFIENCQYEGDLIHLHQPDSGWQKNLALNRAIKASRKDYLIFIDGDCVLHPCFVENHLRLAAPHKVMAGKRIKLDEQTSKLILEGQLKVSEMNSYILKNIKTLKKQGALFVEEGVYIDPDKLIWWIPKIRSMSNLKGCNMSFPKKAIYDINGFDEDYTRPAIGEDIDLTWRFKKAGYHIKSVRNTAVQYHLWHKENWTDQSDNVTLMNEKKARNEYICRNGLEKR